MTHPKRRRIGIEPPEVLELFALIAALSKEVVGFEGTIVRSVGCRYATESDFFSGSGASKSGGRWNRVGIDAVYASLDVITATMEAYQNLIAFRLPLSTIKPRVTAGATVNLGKVFDLTVSINRRRIGFSLRDLIEEDWHGIQSAGEESWTQAIGRGCYKAGFEGLIVPSAKNSVGKNIVIFPGKLLKTSKLKILASKNLK